ncbi:hypothetical protein OROGR_006322 [Orobanche gracilis]
MGGIKRRFEEELDELRSTADSSRNKRRKNSKREKMQPEECPCRNDVPTKILYGIISGYRFCPEGRPFDQKTFESSKFWDIVLEEFQNAMPQENLTIDYMIRIVEAVITYHSTRNCDGYGKVFGQLLDFGIPSLKSIKAGCSNQFHTSPPSMQNPTLTQNTSFSPVAPLTGFQYQQHYHPSSSSDLNYPLALQYFSNDQSTEQNQQNHDSSSQPTTSGHVQPPTVLLVNKLLQKYLKSGFPNSVYHRVLRRMSKNSTLELVFLDQSDEDRIVWLAQFVKAGDFDEYVDWKRSLKLNQ